MLRRLRSTPGYLYVIAAVSAIVLTLLMAQLSAVRPLADRRVALDLAQRDLGLFVESVTPGGPADRAGLVGGDRLLAIDGRLLVDADDYDAAARLFQRDAPSAFRVERGDAIRVVEVRPGVPPDWWFALLITAVVLFCLVVGGVCLAGRTADIRARLLAVAFFLIALEFAMPSGASGPGWLAVSEVSFYLLLGSQVAVELHLAAMIPYAMAGRRSRRTFVAGCYLAGGAIAAIGSLTYAVEFAGAARLPFNLAQVDALLLSVVFPTWAIGMMILLARATFSASTYRRRLQAIVVLLGVSPWAIYTIVDWARGYPEAASPRFTQLLPFLVLFFPAAVFVAIFRFRLFDLPPLLRRSLLYTGLTSSLVLILYAALGAGGAVFSRIVQGEGASVWSMSLATLILGLLIAPFRRATREFVDRRFFPERQALRTRLIGLASELPALGKLDRMGQHLVRSLRQIFGTSSATLLLVEASSGALYQLAASPTPPSGLENPFFLARDDPAIARLSDARRPLAGWDLLGSSPALENRLGRARVALAVPLFQDKKLVGILLMGQRVTRERFTAEEVALLSLVAHQVATVLENVRLFQSATYEGLTGLLRREAALEVLDGEIDRAQRYVRPLTVALADIDHFKQINDCFGHLEGDRVLRIVADALQSVVRGSDVVGRYGGEEFLLIFPETDIEAAGDLSEKLRRAIERLELCAEDGSSIEVRVSIGVAGLSSLPGDTVDSERFIAAADRELYRAKAAGRNRVEPRVATSL